MRTVRSAARARNQPRATLAACFLLVVLGLLLALTARAAAAAEGAEGAEGADAAMRGAAADDDEDEAADPDEAAPDEAAPPSAIPRLELGVASAAGFADAGELFDVGLRHQRPSRWGRLDLVLTWRRRLGDAAAGGARADELWLLAIWRR